MHNVHESYVDMLMMRAHLGVAKGEVGVFEEDVHMHPSHIQLLISLQLHLVALRQGPVPLTCRLHTCTDMLLLFATVFTKG
jgi:hypothetical protein